MRIGIRGKLLLLCLGVLLVATLAEDLFLSREFERAQSESLARELRVQVDLAARLAEARASELHASSGWDRLADDVGARTGGRITYIDRDGRVLGDSTLDAAALAHVENHARRPEVRAALEDAFGEDVRYSETIERAMHYVAAPWREGGRVAGVARIALPLTEVEHAVERVHRTLLFGTLLAFVVAGLLAAFAAEWTSRRLSRLVETARRMAGGDLDVRVSISGGTEFALLGGALEHLARSLSSSLRELRRERDLVAGILDGMHEGVLLVAPEGRIALVNPALREMLLLPAELRGKLPIEVFRHAELNDLLARVRTGREAESEELELGGLKPRRLFVRAQALEGEPAGVLAVFVDVTDLRRLEALRRDFVANVSHELRTPVAAVSSAAETLRDALARDPQAAPVFLDMIERNATRLTRLVEDLLDLSRLDARMYRLQHEAIDAREALVRAVSLVRDAAAGKGIAIEVDAPGGLPRLDADPRALEQILSNLLENAIKYCPDGTSVRVGARAADGRVRLTVEDTGPGIEAKHLPRVFERFYRVDKGRARDVGGTGLGLSIVKNLAEAMGGSVSVESTPGKGSTFGVTLPAREA